MHISDTNIFSPNI